MTYELLSPVEVLAEKLKIWELRAMHSRGNRRIECLLACDDLRKKIGALQGQDA